DRCGGRGPGYRDVQRRRRRTRTQERRARQGSRSIAAGLRLLRGSCPPPSRAVQHRSLLGLAALGRVICPTGADLTFAPHPAASSQANVKSKAPLESIISSGPSIPTFAIVPAEKGCECWNWTTRWCGHLSHP